MIEKIPNQKVTQKNFHTEDVYREAEKDLKQRYNNVPVSKLLEDEKSMREERKSILRNNTPALLQRIDIEIKILSDLIKERHQKGEY